MQVSLSQFVPFPRPQVFEFLADPSNRPQWQGSLTSIDLQTAGAPGLGTRWFEKPKGGPRFEMEICAFDPYTHWAERFHAKQATGTVALHFHEQPGGTRVDLRADVDLHGIFRLGAPLAALVLRREMRKDLGRVGDCLAKA